MGNLELNAFLPLIADCLLGSLDLLANACDIFRRLCVEGIEADEARCRAHVDNATAILTALVEHIGYKAAQDLAAAARTEHKTVRQLVLERGLVSPEQARPVADGRERHAAGLALGAEAGRLR